MLSLDGVLVGVEGDQVRRAGGVVDNAGASRLGQLLHEVDDIVGRGERLDAHEVGGQTSDVGRGCFSTC